MSANLFLAATVFYTKKHEIEDQERREAEREEKTDDEDFDWETWGNTMHRLEDL